MGGDSPRPTLCDEFPTGFGPAHCEIVAAQIFARCKRIRFDSVAEVLIHVSSQDRFTQSTRAAVHDKHQLTGRNAGSGWEEC